MQRPHRQVTLRVIFWLRDVSLPDPGVGQMPPGEKTARRMHPDTREWWIVEDGQIQFNIDGQESFIAKKGYLVQVPFRTFYSMETIGDKPSLRVEVNIANAICRL